MDFIVDNEIYKKYLTKDETIRNDRIRPDDINFFDAILSINMKDDPDGKIIIEKIKALQ